MTKPYLLQIKVLLGDFTRIHDLSILFQGLSHGFVTLGAVFDIYFWICGAHAALILELLQLIPAGSPLHRACPGIHFLLPHREFLSAEVVHQLLFNDLARGQQPLQRIVGLVGVFPASHSWRRKAESAGLRMHLLHHRVLPAVRSERLLGSYLERYLRRGLLLLHPQMFSRVLSTRMLLQPRHGVLRVLQNGRKQTRISRLSRLLTRTTDCVPTHVLIEKCLRWREVVLL